jgi:hypothetical protein
MSYTKRKWENLNKLLLIEEIKDGQHRDMVSVYLDDYDKGRDMGLSHEVVVGNLVDRLRDECEILHIHAVRCVHEILWDRCGVQTMKEDNNNDADG